MPHFAIAMNDGSIAIMQTVGNATPEECMAKWERWEGDRRVNWTEYVTAHKQIDPADIPQDRTYRDAWVLNGDKIEHDMDKVAAIHVERLAQVALEDSAALAKAEALDAAKAKIGKVGATALVAALDTKP